jgi:RNA polymerase sigma-70 factor (ECF subfamily)
MNNELLFKKITGIDFSSFYNEYKPKLTWHLSNITQNTETAEDFADEAFLQGLNKLDTYNIQKGAIHTWIFTIGKNLVFKEIKENQKIQSISIDKEYDDNITISDYLSDDDIVTESIQDQETITKANLCKNAIYNLPPKYKEVLILREIENLSYNDISEKLSRNLSTVKSQIKKGREILRKKLEKKFKNINENGIADINIVSNNIKKINSNIEQLNNIKMEKENIKIKKEPENKKYNHSDSYYRKKYEKLIAENNTLKEENKKLKKENKKISNNNKNIMNDFKKLKQNIKVIEKEFNKKIEKILKLVDSPITSDTNSHPETPRIKRKYTKKSKSEKLELNTTI